MLAYLVSASVRLLLAKAIGWSSLLCFCMRHVPRSLIDASTCTVIGNVLSSYLLGRSFIAESDHKPLEMIAMKNLANAPPHLQRML